MIEHEHLMGDDVVGFGDIKVPNPNYGEEDKRYAYEYFTWCLFHHKEDKAYAIAFNRDVDDTLEIPMPSNIEEASSFITTAYWDRYHGN